MKKNILRLTIIIFITLIISCGDSNKDNDKQIGTSSMVEVSKNGATPVTGGESFELKAYTYYSILTYSKDIVKLEYSNGFDDTNKTIATDGKTVKIPNSAEFLKIYFIDENKEMKSKVFEISKIYKSDTKEDNQNIKKINLTWDNIDVSNEEMISIHKKDAMSYYISYAKIGRGLPPPLLDYNYTDEISISSAKEIINNLTPNEDYEFKIKAKSEKGYYSDYYYIYVTINEKNELSIEEKNDKLYIKISEDESYIIMAKNEFGLIRTIKEGTGAWDIEITPDGKYVLARGLYENFTLWNISTGKLIKTFKSNADYIFLTAITANGKYIITHSFILDGNNSSLEVWDIKTGEVITTFIHSYEYYFISITSSEKNILLFKYSDSTIYTLDIITKKLTKMHKIHKVHSDFKTTNITPNGKYALSIRSDKTLILWDIKTGELIRTFEGHKEILNARITPDGKYVVSKLNGTSVALWDIETGELLQTFKEYTGYTSKIAITPDGKYVLLADSSYILVLRSIKTGEVIKRFEGHTSLIVSMAITPDGKYVLSGDTNGNINVWDIPSSHLLDENS